MSFIVKAMNDLFDQLEASRSIIGRGLKEVIKMREWVKYLSNKIENSSFHVFHYTLIQIQDGFIQRHPCEMCVRRCLFWPFIASLQGLLHMVSVKLWEIEEGVMLQTLVGSSLGRQI